MELCFFYPPNSGFFTIMNDASVNMAYKYANCCFHSLWRDRLTCFPGAAWFHIPTKGAQQLQFVAVFAITTWSPEFKKTAILAGTPQQSLPRLWCDSPSTQSLCVFSHVYSQCVYLPRRNVCLSPLPVLNCAVFLLLTCRVSLHILGIKLLPTLQLYLPLIPHLSHGRQSPSRAWCHIDKWLHHTGSRAKEGCSWTLTAEAFYLGAMPVLGLTFHWLNQVTWPRLTLMGVKKHIPPCAWKARELPFWSNPKSHYCGERMDCWVSKTPSVHRWVHWFFLSVKATVHKVTANTEVVNVNHCS